MQFIRKHKKLSIVIIVLLAGFLILDFTYAGYIKNIVNNYILESKEFYFNSSVLKVNGKVHSINNWDGVNSYSLTIDVNSRKNEVKSTNADIEYNITYECSDNITCESNKTTGVIRKGLKTDTYQITITPIKSLSSNEQAVVKTYATSTSPYEKTLYATYIIGVEKSNFSYNIEDSINSKYLVLNLTNSVGFYEVEKAFLNYNVGDLISLDNYLALDDVYKDNCFSAKVVITVPTDKLALDMTNNSYLNKDDSSLETVVISSHKYVSKYMFKLEATSSQKIIFYKYDVTKDYTYPIVNEQAIIGVDVIMAK